MVRFALPMDEESSLVMKMATAFVKSMPEKFSEEYQAEFYRKTLGMVDRIPTLRGMSPWILKDFRSPRRQNPEFQQGWNRKGLISETGQRKQAFGVLAGYYEGKER